MSDSQVLTVVAGGRKARPYVWLANPSGRGEDFGELSRAVYPGPHKIS